MGARAIRILIADDHDVVRQGIRSYLEKHGNWAVIGEACTGRDAVDFVKNHSPDIVIMDISMPELNGLDATRHILAHAPKTQILVLTMHDSETVVRNVFASGARGYILKSGVTRDLVPAIEALASGKPYLAAEVSEVVLQEFLQTPRIASTGGPTARVTSREREILQLLAEGRTNKEIAVKLDLSVRTVECHRANLMEKLNMHSLADLIRYAIQNQVAT